MIASKVFLDDVAYETLLLEHLEAVDGVREVPEVVDLNCCGVEVSGLFDTHPSS